MVLLNSLLRRGLDPSIIIVARIVDKRIMRPRKV
jgi:hypothetical protein